MAGLEFAETGNETVAGVVVVIITKVKKGMYIELTVPEGSEAVVYVPVNNKKVTIDGKKVT